MAEKILILYDNRVDEGTMSASSEAGGLGADNLQDRLLSKVARTTGVAAEWWRADFGQTEAVSTVALWNHNFTVNATVRVRLSDNADMSSPVYDVTDYAWPSIYGFDEIGWDMDGFDGTPDLSVLNAFKPYKRFRTKRNFCCRARRASCIFSQSPVIPFTYLDLHWNGVLLFIALCGMSGWGRREVEQCVSFLKCLRNVKPNTKIAFTRTGKTIVSRHDLFESPRTAL